MNTKTIQTILFFLTLSIILTSIPAFSADPLYLQNNIHIQSQKDKKGKEVHRGSYAGYVDPGSWHSFIPVNTEVTIEVKGGFRGKGIVITLTEDGKVIHFEYSKRNMKQSMKEYMNTITSTQKVDLSKLSKKDRNGIKEGKALVGMSKRGVRIALGYPAEHRTPSMDQDSWTYWKNRYVTTAIEFDKNGKVASIR